LLPWHGAKTQAQQEPSDETEQIQQELSTAPNGYMVEVHTCDKKDAGTNSTIQMKLLIRDPNGDPRELGPWTQDHTHLVNGREYDDHERYGGEEGDGWDRYFFPETTAARHIDELILTSDGDGNKPGWCWDTHFVTRIEGGMPVRTWAWVIGESPWMYGETTHWKKFNDDTMGENILRPVPADLDCLIPGGKMKPPTAGSITVRTFFQTFGGYGCGDNVIFRLRSTGFIREVMPTIQRISGTSTAVQDLCVYSTRFDPVSPGTQTVDRLSTDRVWTIDCKSVNVTAGQESAIDLAFNKGCPQ
jgi:hypothetical protein